MKKNELLDIVTVIVMAYPDRIKQDSIAGMVTAWYAFFKDDDAKIVELAVTRHISCNKWVPSIAEIREGITDILHPEIIPPDIAWTMVADVMYTYGMYDSRRPTLPPMIERVAQTIGWSALYEMHRGSLVGNKDGLDKLAFMDLYKPAYERAKQVAMLPIALSDEISKVQPLKPDIDKYLIGADSTRNNDVERYAELLERMIV